MNCLLVSYTSLGVNSTEHVMAFGCGLARLGRNVRLAIPPSDPSRTQFDFYQLGTESDLTPLPTDERIEPADIVHVWTPRAPIWRFLEQHSRLIRGPLVLHLEDDEDEVLSLFGGGRIKPEAALMRADVRAQHLGEWAHPDLSRCLAHAVDAITILSPELREKVPRLTPCLHVVPPLAPPWIGSIPAAELPPELSRKPTLIYAGGLHAAVADDFVQLCQAVGSLANNGHAVNLVRCGPIAPPELLEIGKELAVNFFDLGHLPVPRLRALLANAAVLVQPGGPTAFNRRRFPSKLVPYLASGTPVVMPACYDWLGVKPDQHVRTFANGSAADIAEAIVSVLDQPEASRQMASRAAEFARIRFDLGACCVPLQQFYQKLPGQSRVNWRAIKKPRVELPLMMADAARASKPRVFAPFYKLFRPPENPLIRLAREGRFRDSLPAATRLMQVALEELREPPLVSTQRVAVAQFYWPQEKGLCESASDSQAYLSGRWRRLVFGPFQMTANLHPRLDPGNLPGTYEIAAISYRGKTGTMFERLRGNPPSFRNFTPAGSIVELPTHYAPVTRWFSTGCDPQLMLRRPSRPDVAYLECWIKWIPFD